MLIAFTHNLKRSDSEAEAEFDAPETVAAISEALERLGHRVERIDVGGPPSRVLSRLEALVPDLVFNTAEGSGGRFREAFSPAVFDRLGLPFTGSDAYVCALTMDKAMAKRVVSEAGVPTPKAALVTGEDSLNALELSFPVILKPNFEGSSVGVSADSIIKTKEALAPAIRAMLARFPDGVLVEEFVVGRDFSVGWLERAPGSGILAPAEYEFAPGSAGEPGFEIYDFKLKNENPDAVTVRVPANLEAGVLAELERFAGIAVRTLGLRDLARVDFRVTAEGAIRFIEVNALPSLEPGASLYEAAKLRGLDSIDRVLESVVSSAALRFGADLRPRTARRSRRALRVGFTYNEKRVTPGYDPVTDAEVEFDAPKTLNSIRGAIASFGHTVIDLEATPDLSHKLIDADVDVVFNIAEGIQGRNRESQVPALLELVGIPYTGSDATTLALTLDKGLAKRLVSEVGVRTPAFQLFITGKEKLSPGLSFPLVVKPLGEGSSKGVHRSSVVYDEAALRKETGELIDRYGQTVIAEEFLPGREFTVALLGEKRPRVLPPMEIVFSPAAGKDPVYTYAHKLDVNEEVRYEAPAKLEPALRARLERASRAAFRALGCRDVARVDLRLDAKGHVNFIECNPLPGLTPGWSDLCLIAEGAGMDYPSLIREIMDPAIRRYKDATKQLLKAETPAS